MATAEMAKGIASEDEILLHVQGLVSYKWLSRNFSLSSNTAKRLLHKFAKLNDNSDLQIVYAISGWSKKETQSYMIQLVTQQKLEEVKASLEDTPSIHVYSVQRCLPKDPAQLWSPDFVQAEQLFNESAESNNCLRDNRFSAVTCGLVQRLPTRKSSRVTSPAPPRVPVPSESAKPPLVPTIPLPKAAPIPSKPVTPVPPKKSDATPKDDGSAGKKPTKSSISPKTLHTEAKDSSGPANAGKRKTPAATGGSASGNSLASIWGKAPARKAVSPQIVPPSETAAKPPRTYSLAGDAEARLQALEEEDGSEEDDMVKEFTSMRRGQVPNGGGRRRRMIVDEGDDDDHDGADCPETIIRLGTPESPEKGRPVVAAEEARDAHVTNKGALSASVQDKLPSPDQETLNVGGKPLKRRPNARPNLDSKSKANSRENASEVEALPATPGILLPDLARVSSKRKKVLKSRIDERGREVTEVVWEGEEQEDVEKDKDQATNQSASSLKQNDIKPPAAKPQAVQKPSMAQSKTTASKTNSKASAKSAAGKLGKGQGNIMSFFKKT